ncbi:MAG: hypothetical protein GY796_19500, partial [Chloroflexi bacterium]|nr:hypothetical protein [Chloroflexota bacterium]
MKRISLMIVTGLPLLGLWLLLGVLAEDVHAADISGDITTDTTWTAVNSPYVITGAVRLLAGVMLTVEAGVEVQAQNNSGLIIQGHLQTLGSPTQPVTFTSVTQTGPGDWYWIEVASTGSISMTGTAVQYATTGLIIDGPNNNHISLKDSLIQYNQTAMIVDAQSLHRLQMDNVTFQNNTVNRIFIETIYPDNDALTENVTLSPQPGLEGYEISG